VPQLPRHPQIYEINTRVWLHNLSSQVGQKLTLGTVPQTTWEGLKDLGMDLVWLMGVWRPSPEAIAIDRHNPQLAQVCRNLLPDFQPEDLIGSPYAVADYSLNPALGSERDLLQVRDNLRRAGLGLFLDFVPNHTAPDHPWVTASPGRYVATESAAFFTAEEAFQVSAADGSPNWIAHGRDPYFAPWPDTAQLCSPCPDTRGALSGELLKIGQFCDGLRCDMAMLPLNRIFAQTWKAWLEHTGKSLPAQDYWPEILAVLKAKYPEFLLMAEVYWGLEPELLAQGIDYAYDKAGYDRLRAFQVPAFRQGLLDEGERRTHMVRFLENHDEERLAAAFPAEAHRSAAVIHATLPGLRLFQDGQLERRRIKLPVQLGREPAEPADPEFTAFYRKLLSLTRQPLFKDGTEQILPVLPPVPGDQSHQPLVALAYSFKGQIGVIAVNFSNRVASGFLQFPEGFWQGWEQVPLRDEMREPVPTYLRDRRQLASQGFYVLLEPYGFHFLIASAKE
jgi:hypothetical protein